MLYTLYRCFTIEINNILYRCFTIEINNIQSGFHTGFFAGGGRNGCVCIARETFLTTPTMSWTTPSFTVIGSILDIFKEKNSRILL